MSFTDKDQLVIGKQTWLTKNIDLVQFRNGDAVPHIANDDEWELAGTEGRPACCYYNNNPENMDRHGLLYNSFAVHDPRGLAPEGWRIPTAEDWDELINFLGGQKSAGKKMKTADAWMMKENGGNGSGDNESGFNAWASGQRNFIGQFNRLNLSCSWWSASINDHGTNWFYYLDHDSDKIGKGISDPEDGLSIRLIKA